MPAAPGPTPGSTTGRTPPLLWPKKARIAVTFTVAFESFVKHSQYSHGARSDQPDYASLAYGEFGGRAGIWRIMEILDRHGVKGTIDINGLAAEKYPDALRKLHAGGHEIVGHGWANDIYIDSLDAQQEKDLITKSINTLASITGERPIGWVSPGHRRTEHTFAYLVDQGIIWSGDVPSDEVPYHIEVNGKPLVIMPRIDYANDLSTLFQPKNPPSVYLEYYKAAFDMLYGEGEAGSPKTMDALVHAHFGGRPNMAGVFEQCIRYAKGFSGVWFCTKGEIAQWYLKNRVGQTRKA